MLRKSQPLSPLNILKRFFLCNILPCIELVFHVWKKFGYKLHSP